MSHLDVEQLHRAWPNMISILLELNSGRWICCLDFRLSLPFTIFLVFYATIFTSAAQL